MFVFRERFEFEQEVKFATPDGVESSFTARFLYVDDKRWEELAADADADRKILTEVWIGWRGIETPEKAAIGFTPETREQFICQPYVRGAVMRAYVEARHGLKAKN